MKNKELIEKLQEFELDLDVIFWDGTDNHDIGLICFDDVNEQEIILNSANCLTLDDTVLVKRNFTFVNIYNTSILILTDDNYEDALVQLSEVVRNIDEWGCENEEGELHIE